MKEQRLTAVVQRAAQVSKMTTKQLAAELDKAPSTLYQQLNPYDTNGRLGLEEAHDIMLMVGDMSLVRAMAVDFGCRVELMDAEPDGADMTQDKLQAFQAVGRFIDAEDSAGVDCLQLFELMESAIKEMQDVWKRHRELEMKKAG